MTDLEKLRTLLTGFGVGFSQKDGEREITITCEQGYAKVAGYCCFVTLFSFDLEGKFKEMGAYE